MMDVVADTNIWLRIADDHSAQHIQARECVAELLSRGARILLTPQNLIEFWAVATRPRSANGLGWSIEQAVSETLKMRSNFELLPENDSIFDKWWTTVQSERISGKRVHDARLAVHLWVYKISHLLTFSNEDFAKFPWITVLCPRDIRTIE